MELYVFIIALHFVMNVTDIQRKLYGNTRSRFYGLRFLPIQSIKLDTLV